MSTSACLGQGWSCLRRCVVGWLNTCSVSSCTILGTVSNADFKKSLLAQVLQLVKIGQLLYLLTHYTLSSTNWVMFKSKYISSAHHKWLCWQLYDILLALLIKFLLVHGLFAEVSGHFASLINLILSNNCKSRKSIECAVGKTYESDST